MKRRRKAATGILVIVFLVASAGAVYAVDFGFDTYIDDVFVGTVKNYEQVEMAASEAGNIIGDKIPCTPELYLKLIKKGGYSEQKELVNNMIRVALDEKATFKEAICMLPGGIVEGKKKSTGVGSGEFIYPVVAAVSSSFGERWGKNHEGTDFAVPSGTDVLAADSGKISFCGVMDGYGNIIIIDHENGYETYYAHLSKTKKEVGDTVKKGEVIALSGNTGRTTGPHLHFEIRMDGEPRNPEKYLD